MTTTKKKILTLGFILVSILALLYLSMLRNNTSITQTKFTNDKDYIQTNIDLKNQTGSAAEIQ